MNSYHKFNNIFYSSEIGDGVLDTLKNIYGCSEDSKSALMCIHTDNNPMIDYRFPESRIVKSLSKFQENTRSTFSYLDSVAENRQQIHKFRTKNHEGYREMDNIMTLYPGTRSSEIASKEAFKIPQIGIARECSHQPVRYLQEKSYTCFERIDAHQCTGSDKFLLGKYIIVGENIPLNLSDKYPRILTNTFSGSFSEVNVSIFHEKNAFNRLHFNFNDEMKSNNLDNLNDWYKTTMTGFYGNQNFSIKDSENYKFTNSDRLTPSLVTEHSVCSNVVVGIKYIFYWNSYNITNIDVELTMSDIPIDVSNNIFINNSKKDQEVQMNIRQDFQVLFKHTTMSSKNEELGNYSTASSSEYYTGTFSENYLENFSDYSTFRSENTMEQNRTFYIPYNESYNASQDSSSMWKLDEYNGNPLLSAKRMYKHGSPIKLAGTKLVSSQRSYLN